MTENARDLVLVGRIVGLYGVRGWVKVHSYAAGREQILAYDPWHLRIGGEWCPKRLAAGREHGKGIVVQFEGVVDRDMAAGLVGADIAVHRDQLEPLAPGEYYWIDLIGLRVVTGAGVELGRVDHLLETGANDVLVVHGERERLIPYVPGEVVVKVDLEAGVIEVDWDPDF
jgi:16S rRNA processing protein RimM